MTTATKTEIVDYNIAIEKNQLHYPVSVSEAFNLGIKIEQMISNIYSELDRCKSKAAQEILQEFRIQNEQDIAHFLGAFNFYLNCEIGEFYRNSGAVPDNKVEKEIAKTKPLIIRNLENYYHKIETIQNDIKEKDSEEIGKYFNTTDSKDIYKIGMEVRNNSRELYERLSKLYPEGAIKNAFVEMAAVINAGSNKLEEIC